MNIVQTGPAPTERLVECIPLATGESLRVTDPRSLLVYVAQGRVGVFERGTWHAVTLEKGGWYRLGGAGVTSVDAAVPTVILLMSPYETGFARSLVTEPACHTSYEELRAVA